MALRWGGEIFHTLLESYRRTYYCLTNRAGSGAGTAGQARLMWLGAATPIVVSFLEANAVAGVAPGEASALRSLKKSKAALSFVQYVLNIVHSLL